MFGSMFYSSSYHHHASDSSEEEDDYFAEAERRLAAADAAGENQSALSALLDGEDVEVGTATESGPMSDAVIDTTGKCVECLDQVAIVLCEQCNDELCRLCVAALHRRGKRKSHNFVYLRKEDEEADAMARSIAAEVDETVAMDVDDQLLPNKVENDTDSSEETTPSSVPDVSLNDAPVSPHDSDEEEVSTPFIRDMPPAIDNSFKELGKYIPLRLTLKERKQMRLMEASLNTSEYTDNVDIEFKRANRRLHTQLQDICAILSGLVVASNYRVGQAVIQTRNFKEYEGFFRDFFEIGRRYKIMNPENMRADYGKLMYLLQDTQQAEIRQLLEFDCVKPIETVARLLKRHGQELLLQDQYLEMATRAIVPDGKTRFEIRSEVRDKEKAVEYFARKYRTKTLDGETIKHCLYSIGDYHSYLVYNRNPIDKMIAYLEHFFSRDQAEDDEYSLAIYGGKDGARLTHSHERQYNYALQSLMLWRDIIHHMYRLWSLADMDLLSPDMAYELKNTGQGLHRVQQAPLIDKAMRRILHDTQQRVDHWVGSSVIHLGDTNVPNALMFIDKYTQVSRILNPIVLTLGQLPKLYRDENLRHYLMATFGTPEQLTKDILVDFFRSAFDGSGADNFFDAGSCIDGRLTSAWNWCSLIDTKPYYAVFKLAGFIGFDGKFA